VSKTSKQDLLHIYSIGLKLRTLRNEKRLTLSRLSAETGYSTALLSKLETDHMVPTLPTLERICRSYGVGLGYFFCEPSQHSVAITRNAHIKQARKEPPTVKLTPLHMPTANSKQVAKLLDVPPGAASSITESGARTELTAYVIEGTLQLSIAGTEEVLHTGDCVVLNTDAVVVWNAPESHCRVLTVFANS
jgi:transcriptional regulator with XRE-family HTH domain